VLSGRGLCDGLITRPEESYRLWCVAECDLETSRMRRPWPTGVGGGLLHEKKKNCLLGDVVIRKLIYLKVGATINLLAPELFFFNFSTPCI